MITLEVENYCHRCQRFMPTVQFVPMLQCVPLFGEVAGHVDNCAVICQYRDTCRAIEQVIRSEIAAKEGEE